MVKEEVFVYKDYLGEVKLDSLFEYEWKDGKIVLVKQYFGLGMGLKYLTDYIYDSANRVVESNRSRKITINILLDKKTLYEYNDSGQIITQIYQDWDFEWINLGKNVNQYFQDDRISSSVHFDWDGALWEPKFKRVEEIIDYPELFIVTSLDGFPVLAGRDFTFT